MSPRPKRPYPCFAASPKQRWPSWLLPIISPGRRREVSPQRQNTSICVDCTIRHQRAMETQPERPHTTPPPHRTSKLGSSEVHPSLYIYVCDTTLQRTTTLHKAGRWWR
eukprot:364415-Chlamydomonas_euryale.AAC.9